MSDNYFQTYQTQKKEILNLIGKAQNLFNKIDSETWANNAKQSKEKIKNDKFKILVLGEFKRGKSTFINALLKEEVLPAYSVPCTAVINEIEWNQDKKAKLYFKDDIKKDLESYADYLNENPKISDHIKSSDSDIPPLEIDVENLEEYVTIPNPAKKQEKSVAQSPFKKVDLFWPLNIESKGIKIIDSPGLNEHGTRTKVSLDYLSEADAVVFIMSADALASRTEMNYIKNNIIGAGHEEIFFIVNKFDMIRSEKEKNRVKEYARKTLQDKTTLGKDGIYYISSLDALEGRLENNKDKVEQSGILEYEKDLERFLTQERGKVKLSVPTKNILNGIEKVIKEIIPARKETLKEPLEEIESRYEDIKPKLEEKEHHRQQIIKKIENQLMILENDLRFKFEQILKEIAEENIKDWIDNYELDTNLKIISLSQKEQAEQIAEEIANFIQKKFESAFQEKQKSTIEPFLEERIKKIFEENKQEIDSFLEDIDIIKEDMLGDSYTKLEVGKEYEIEGWKRVASAAGGWVIGGVGSAFVGGTLGPKEMLKSLLPNIAIGAGMIAMGILNPLVLIPALLGTGSIQALLKKDDIKGKIKDITAEEIEKQIKNNAEEKSREAVEEIKEKLEALKNNIDEGLANEINNIREEVEAILEKKKEKESEINQRQKELDQISEELKKVKKETSTIINELNSGV